MARSLSSKTNVTAPGGNYPYGRIRDKTLVLAGTPVDEVLLGDMAQFFERLMAVVGISANGNSENSSDGFQYLTALQKLISRTLYSSTTEVSVPGSGTNVDLFSYTLPAGTMTQNGDVIRVTASGVLLANGSQKDLSLTFAGVTCMTIINFITGFLTFRIEAEIIRKTSTTFNVCARLFLLSSISDPPVILMNVAADLSATFANALDIKMRGGGNTVNDITGKMFTVTFDPLK